MVPPDQYRYDVYLSYNEADAEWVFEWLLPRLEKHQLGIAIDALTFQPAVPVVEETERSIRESRFMLAILTPAYVQDNWDIFDTQLIHFQDPGARFRRLIPLLLQPCDPPDRIKLLGWIDLTDPEKQEQQLQRVIDTVQGRTRLPELRPEAAVPKADERRRELGWFTVAGISALLTLVLLGWWIWTQRPPAAMDPDNFNIAVAEFSVIDETGNPMQDPIGRQRARNIAGLLEEQRSELVSILNQPVEIWGNEQRIAPVQEDAAGRAAELSVDVLVYGTIQREGEQWELQPQFFLTEKAVRRATELLGEHALGTRIAFDPQRLASENSANAEMRTRIRVLVQILLGLSHYEGGRTQDYEEAARIFQAAADDPAWGALPEATSGQEVLYLFLGNAYLKSAPMMEEAPEAWAATIETSIQRYRDALARNPGYARAWNGLASALFQQSRLYPYERWPCADDWDWVTLEEAKNAYEYALNMPPTQKPSSGNVDLRAHLGLGRIYYHIGFCLSEEVSPDAWQLARTHFDAAIAEYESAPASHLQSLASIIHLYLGDMAFLEADWRSTDESLQSPENSLRISELSENAQVHYQSAIDLIGRPKTEEFLTQIVTAEAQMVKVLCFQGNVDAALEHLDSFVEENNIPSDLREAIYQDSRRFCDYGEE